MKGFVTCQEAASELISEDIFALTGKKTQAHTQWCEITDCSYKDLAQLAYRAQGAYHVGILLATAPTVNDLLAQLKILSLDDVKDFFQGETPFRVLCAKLDPLQKHPDTIQSTVDIATDVGGAVHDAGTRHHWNLKVQLKGLSVTFIVILTSQEVIFGLDVVGIPLAKRPYKVFTHPTSLNGVLAYTVARLAGVKKKSVVLDPFCDCATIPIEVAIWQQEKSPFLHERSFLGLYYAPTKSFFEEIEKELKETELETASSQVYAFESQVKIMLQAKKNIKLSSVHGAIACSKVSVDWLDTKFEEKTVDVIITNPVESSKRVRQEKKIEKLMDELFYQARFLLKKTGTIGLVLTQPERVVLTANKHGFVLKKNYVVFGGQQQQTLSVFVRK